MPLKPTYPLNLFFDGACPLCVKEVAWLARIGDPQRLQLVDVNTLDTEANLPSRADLLATLHARDRAGTWYRGVDATVVAWQAAGVGGRVAWLRWPLIYPLAKVVYRLFARHRHAISRLFGAKVCDERCMGAARTQLAQSEADKH